MMWQSLVFQDNYDSEPAAGRILIQPPKLAAGSRQNSQAGGLRYVAQPSRLRVCGASEPRVPAHRQQRRWWYQDAPPAAGRKENDLRLSAGIQYKFWAVRGEDDD